MTQANSADATLPKVAFLGLGVMGSGMAGQLLTAGFPLTVYNRSEGRAGPLVERGATKAASPRAAAEGADVVVAMVADDVVSRAVWLGEHGALAGMKPGAVAIESSTLSTDWVGHLAEAAAARGCGFIEAPVTGTKPHAANGELLFLVGGEAETLARVRPLLDAMGRDTIHLGPTGSGAYLKLVNNFMCGVQAATLAEALALIERSDLDRDKALAILTGGAPGSPLVNLLSGRMTARDYTVNFALKLMRKDLSYGVAEAQARGVVLETAMGAIRQFDRAVAAGSGEQDMAALVEVLRPPGAAQT